MALHSFSKPAHHQSLRVGVPNFARLLSLFIGIHALDFAGSLGINKTCVNLGTRELRAVGHVKPGSVAGRSHQGIPKEDRVMPACTSTYLPRQVWNASCADFLRHSFSPTAMSKLTAWLKRPFSEHFDRLPGAPLPPPSTVNLDSPSLGDLFRYRFQRGVNLGSWFVLERWIAESPYCNATSPGQSDLDVARGHGAKGILENHWDTWITEADWAWIAERGFTAVRLPIGYYHLCGADPSVLKGTDFEGLDHVYQGAWRRIAHALATANRYGLGVLLDLHAAPGKQNRDAHAGTSNEPRFFTKANMAHTIHVLSVLVAHVNACANSYSPPLHNVIGIELLNEPQQDTALEHWYLDAMHALRSADPSVPIYIGDSWATDQYAGFIEAHAERIPFTVLDHHLYRCFTAEDGSTPAAQHTRALRDSGAGTPQMLARVSQTLEAAGGALVIGEWSGALNPGSLHGAVDEHHARTEFVAAQLALYEQHCAGYFFWTFKRQQPGDSGWSLRDAVGSGVFPSLLGIRARDVVLRDDPERNERKHRARDQSLGQHQAHWSQWPGHYEHWRFDDGFIRGWDDAWTFFRGVAALPAGAPVPELGFKGPWMKHRIREHVAARGNSHIWEFEHGFRQGLGAARSYLLEIAA